MKGYDFSGWATKNNLRCSDGRVILPDAFKADDGQEVPLVWNHQHNAVDNVLGHAMLENRPEGVYMYGWFNDTPTGKMAKDCVKHGDIKRLSIFANNLKEQSKNVMHGVIREVSLVLAAANPGAYIDTVLSHSDDPDGSAAIIYTGLDITLCHSDESDPEEDIDDPEVPEEDEPVDPPQTVPEEDPENVPGLEHSATKDGAKTDPATPGTTDPATDPTVADVVATMNEEQLNVTAYLTAQALEQGLEEGMANQTTPQKGGSTTMKHNCFEGASVTEVKGAYLSHSDQEQILKMAQQFGKLSMAIEDFTKTKRTQLAHAMEEEALADGGTLEHAFTDADTTALFPDFKDVYGGAPELLTRDQGWVGVVMDKVTKSPISRIRTRQVDIRNSALRAQGYQKGKKKINMGNSALLKRTTDPQTVYIKDALNRDDIIDIVDFDVVNYQYGVMKILLNEEVAVAAMIGDGRDVTDDAKISEEHIRPIWKDDDLYTIHVTVDVAAMKTKLQGTNTGLTFGDNYVYAEAIVEQALYGREHFKGSGTPDFYCDPHLLNQMLLARDMNGRRIYDSKADLAKALNVNDIYTAEQFAGALREYTENATVKHKKLLGIFVNMTDYQFGATKGGEISQFNQFDIDYNQQKYLIETRLSGALTRVYSAIALEEEYTAPAQG